MKKKETWFKKDGKLHHFAGVYDGKEYKIYIDGKLQEFEGTIDSITVWDKELSEKEIWMLSGSKLPWWIVWIMNRYRSLQLKIKRL